MPDAILEMEQILGKECEIYREIYNIEEQKISAIMEREGTRIEVLSAEQERLLGEVNRLEKRRLIVAADFMTSRGMEGETTLREMAQAMDEDAAGRMLKTGMELKVLLMRISTLQETNAGLLEDNMEFYNIMLSGLRDTTSINTGYSSNGREENRVANPVLFNKTV